MRQGEEISNSSKYVTFNNGTLRINNLETADGGLYRCFATNEGGMDTKNVTLDEQCMLFALVSIRVSYFCDWCFYCRRSIFQLESR